METLLKKVTHTNEYYRLAQTVRDEKKVTAFGVHQNEKPFICTALNGFVLYVVSDYVQAQETLRALNANGENYVYVSHRQDVLLFKSSSGKTEIAQTNKALYSLKKAKGAVVCVEALIQPFVNVETFFNSVIVLEKNKDYGFTKLTRNLVQAGYVRENTLSSVGDFTVRGDILDVYISQDLQVRINFFGDTVESIYSLKDNLNEKELDFVEILPLFESTPTNEGVLQSIEKIVNDSKISENAKSRARSILTELELQNFNGQISNSWLFPFATNSYLADYLPNDTIVCYDEPKSLLTKIDFVYTEHNLRMANLLSFGEVLPLHHRALLNRYDAFDKYRRFSILSLQSLNYQCSFFSPNKLVPFSVSAVPLYKGNVDQLAKDVSLWNRDGYQVLICCNNTSFETVTNLLKEKGVYCVSDGVLTDGRADAILHDTFLSHGFVSHTNKLVVIGNRDAFVDSKRTIVSKNKKQVFLSVEKGDYVVHEIQGIGLCEGIVRMSTPSGEEKDFFKVLYKDGTMYVPVENSNQLSRYSGGEKPTLSKFGGKDFAKTVEKVKKSIREMSIDLVKLYSERERPRGFKYVIDDYLDEEFSSSFAFVETEDQLKCIKEIDSDLQRDRIMDRLLCGDVGYGKTEVALRTAFKVVANKKQVALLCPTTILAEQHFNTFQKRLQFFDVKVECLNRFRTKKQQEEIIRKVHTGEIDVIIGTHRLLSKDVGFSDLGLLILDEEQRFGVEHKEKLKTLKKSVDVLTMSATPIPRTLHMALSGIRDISTITTPPKQRIPIQTFVVEESEAIIRDVITRELNRNGQVYFVYNSVESMDAFYQKLRQIVPEAKIAVAHGQMEEKRLEDAVKSFMDKKNNVLLCSTIIENGIDMPNANTMIVYDADKLGLSQLYQLRGRVGRSDKIAYAYFVYKSGKILSQIAYKRLSSILEYSELGSGFKIALKDLEIRGAGNVLGREQHGHMAQVGYEKYIKLLNEVMNEVQGKVVVEETPLCEVEIDLSAYAPEDFMLTVDERMDFYQTVAQCNTIESLQQVKKNVSEIYGALPKQVENLFAISTMKILGQQANVEQIKFQKGLVTLKFDSKEHFLCEKVFLALGEYSNVLSVGTQGYSLNVNTSTFLQKERSIELIQKILGSLL